MNRFFVNYLVIAALVISAAFTACKNDKDDDENGNENIIKDFYNPKKGDVYAVGEGSNTAILWKNGVAQNLTDETSVGIAYSVFVSGSDVYVAGSRAILWKNGVEQNITDGTRARSVFVSGSDVYVAGYGRNHINAVVAKVWKNGVEQNLSGGSMAYSIFVVE